MNKIILFLLLFTEINLFWSNFEIQKLYIQKKIDFITFIHEFHHFVEITECGWDLEEVYLIIPKNFFNKKLNPSINKIQTLNKNNTLYYIQLIKHKLAGYAAEAAFEETSLLLNLLTKERYKKNFYLLSEHNKKFFLKIKDIEEAITIINNIKVNDPAITEYIRKYKELKLDIIPKHFYEQYKEKPDMLAYMTTLVMIYEDLKKSYKSTKHQKKINEIIKNNPNLMSYEIFFYKDLKSLWENNLLKRDLSLESFSEKEKLVIAHLKKLA